MGLSGIVLDPENDLFCTLCLKQRKPNSDGSLELNSLKRSRISNLLYVKIIKYSHAHNEIDATHKVLYINGDLGFSKWV